MPTNDSPSGVIPQVCMLALARHLLTLRLRRLESLIEFDDFDPGLSLAIDAVVATLEELEEAKA